jgi:hypothetical protein
LAKKGTPYTTDEDRVILEFILKGKNLSLVNGLTVWKELEAKMGEYDRVLQWPSIPFSID